MSIIKLKDIDTSFGDRVIHDGVSLEVNEGEIYAILGGSGTGKSVLMKKMIMLLENHSGSINILGKEINNISFKDAQDIRLNYGVLFQFGALYSSMTITENIEVQLKEYTDISEETRKMMVQSKIKLVGLDPFVGDMYPSELSGGMVKRAALARSLIMEPRLLFLDEPTSGLDPVGARRFDELILNLKNMLGITVVMITHDLDSIFSIVDRMAILADKKVVSEGNLETVLKSKHPFVEEFFNNEYTQKKYGDVLNV